MNNEIKLNDLISVNPDEYQKYRLHFAKRVCTIAKIRRFPGDFVIIFAHGIWCQYVPKKGVTKVIITAKTHSECLPLLGLKGLH